MEFSLDFIKDFLNALGFSIESESDNEIIYSKTYTNYNNYEIKIKLNKNKPKKSIVYYNPKRETTEEQTPEPNGYIQLGDLTTSNFENPENFVVLEVVNRLLEKGYKPENIHLERKFKLGRTGKSGRVDITVYYPQENSNEPRKTFMIIECKTWGEEFEKEKVRMSKNGGQLFSYFQQDKSTKLLVLYTSTFDNGEIAYDNVIIRVDDGVEEAKKLIKECQEKRKEGEALPCSFSEANSVPELVDVWKRVYRQFIYKNGIFEEDAGLYSLDLKPLKKKDLIEMTTAQGLFNAFAEILRHNNISDNANAFNKMVNLFLCKIVDEEKKGDDDVLDFQVKFGEGYEQLIDRLQRLYKVGMEKYLGIKDFVYYSDDDIRNIIRLYPKRTPLEKIEEIFREIKYYTNSDFAFIEIHNKELFKQNALILTEVIELIQRYRLKHTHKHQILGDFFELLLNHGVKQSQGQFFTPLPIVRFMIISVALDDWIERKQKELEETLPKILDFACGVAHFLTEAIDEINKIIKEKNLMVRIPWEERYIFGIEKDYRLAKTAKIACFLNGDGTANIIHGDGLDHHEKLTGINFDIILSNPPYSVDGFKKYLEVKPRYELLDYLTENSKEIEVLFIERAKQVLEEKGRVAIILPSSILTNSGIYKKAREMILKYFEIKGVAEFGSQTFIATGTNTVILFLQRRKDGFAIDRERIAKEVFDEREIKKNDYVDIKKLLIMFAEFRDLPYEDYKKFVFEDEITENLKNTEIFKLYESKINEFEEVKQEKRKREFSRLSEEEQNQRLIQLFKNAIRRIEKEKFFYFTLMLREGKFYNDENWYKFQKVVVARTPQGTEEQKKYLGYEFSKRRGYEGIEIYKDENGKPTTKLYDDENYDNKEKVAYYIRESFKNELEEVSVDEEIKEYVSIYNLPEFFDFDKEDFDLVINLSPKKRVVINTKWEMRRLGEVVDIVIGGTPRRDEPRYWLNGNNPWVSVAELNGEVIYDTKEKITDEGVKNSNVNLIPKGTTLVSFKLSIGKVGFTGIDLYTNEAIASLKPKDKNEILDKYLFYIFKYLKPLENINISGKKFGKSLNTEILANYVQIPVPPLDVQKGIIENIESLEQKEKENQKKIEEFKEMIEEKISQMNGEMKKLGDEYNLYIGSRPKGGAVSYGVISIGGEHIQNGEIDLSNPKYVPQEYVEEKKLEKVKRYDVLMCKDGALSGKVALVRDNIDAVVNEHVFIIRSKDNKIIKNKYLFYLLNSQQWQSKVKNLKTGSAQGGINSTNLKNFKIPVPHLEFQEKIVKEIENLENEIKKLEEENKKTQGEKQEILNKYL